jgi:F-type H+-transporting ATPase subunit b
MISINATLFLQVLNFLVLVFVLNRIMFRPIIKLMRERDHHIERVKREAERVKSETLQLAQKRMKLEMEARKDAGAERARLRAEAKEVADKIFSDHREKVVALRDDVNTAVDRQVQNAKQAIHSEAAVLADEITEKLF